MIYAFLLFLLWLFVWLFLSWPPTLKNYVIGSAVSAFVSFMTIDILVRSSVKGKAPTTKGGILKIPKRLAWFLYYCVVFVFECIKANLDVAYRVIHPDLPIRPGTVKVKIHLRSDIGLTFLANSVTLTPGTTTVDIDKERGFIYIHWLYVRPDYDASKMRLAVVDKFENILKRIFE